MECLVRQLGEAFAVETVTPEPPPPVAARALEEPALQGAVELQPGRGLEPGCEAAARPHRCAGPGLATGEPLEGGLRGCVGRVCAGASSLQRF